MRQQAILPTVCRRRFDIRDPIVSVDAAVLESSLSFDHISLTKFLSHDADQNGWQRNT